MKKRFSTFGLLNFFIVLVLLFRQIYFMNLISSFVVSSEIESGFLLLAGLIISVSLIVYLVYYLPALFVIEVVLNFEYKINLPIVEVKCNQRSYGFIQIKSRLFKKLQVIRC